MNIMAAAIVMGAFVLIGVLLLFGMIIKKFQCSEEVEAVVEKLIPNNDAEAGVSYYPVFTYRYEGMDYRVKSNFSSSFLKLSEGQQVNLFIDPQKPDRFYFSKETIHKVITIVCFLLASAVLMVGFYLAYKNGK